MFQWSEIHLSLKHLVYISINNVHVFLWCPAALPLGVSSFYFWLSQWELPMSNYRCVFSSSEYWLYLLVNNISSHLVLGYALFQLFIFPSYSVDSYDVTFYVFFVFSDCTILIIKIIKFMYCMIIKSMVLNMLG